MKVSINTPCHENWDAMEPNEKGAFCLSCQKSVVDFSNKTTNEIKSFFRSIADTQKVCGRFKEEQLTELTFDDFFARFKKWILLQKIAIILFFIFGLSLFSCQTTHGHLMGDVAIEEPIEVMGKVAYIEDTTKIVKPVEKPMDEIREMKMGEVAVEPTTTQTVTPKQPDNIKQLRIEDVYVKGDVAFEPDTIKKPNCIKKDTLLEKHKMGKIKIGD